MGEVVEIELINTVGGERSIILNPTLLSVISDFVNEHDYLIMADGNAIASSDGKNGLFMLYLATPRHGVCGLTLDISNLMPLIIGQGDLSILLDTHARHALDFYRAYTGNKKNPKIGIDVFENADKAAFNQIITHRISDPRYLSNLYLVGKHIDYLDKNRRIDGMPIFDPATRDFLVQKLCDASDITRLNLNNGRFNFPFIKSMFKEIPFLSKEILGSDEHAITINFLHDLRLAIEGFPQTPNIIVPELNILFGRDSSDDDRIEAAARLKIILNKISLETIQDYYLDILMELDDEKYGDLGVNFDEVERFYPKQFEAVTALADQINSHYKRFIANKEPIENYFWLLENPVYAKKVNLPSDVSDIEEF